MTAEQIAAGLKRQIAMDTHRLALMPECDRARYELEWRTVILQETPDAQ